MGAGRAERLAAAVLLLLAGAQGWSGPKVEVEHGNGWPMLRIDGEPAPAQWLVVHGMSPGNASTPPYTAFDIQIAGAASAGIRLVEVGLTGDCCIESSQATGWVSDSHPLPNASRAALDRAIELHPTIIFVLRFYAQQPDPPPALPGPKPGVLGWGDLDDVVMSNGNGSFHMVCDSGNQYCTRMNSITSRWTSQGRSRIKAMLSYMDRQYPKRIAGVHPNSECCSGLSPHCRLTQTVCCQQCCTAQSGFCRRPARRPAAPAPPARGRSSPTTARPWRPSSASAPPTPSAHSPPRTRGSTSRWARRLASRSG